MAGLFAGNLLLRHGWDVQVLERSAEGLAARGAGIATQRVLSEALAKAGVTLADGLGIRLGKRVGYEPDGTIVAEWPYPQTTTSWGLLYNRLLAAFPAERFQQGAVVSDVFQTEDEAGVVLRDGRRLTADLVIGADGMRSGVRGRLALSIAPLYAGYVAWRGMLDERDMPPALAADAFESFNVGFYGHEQLVGYPVAGADGSIEPGRRRFNMMWYRPANDEKLRHILTGSTNLLHDGGIPPHLIRQSVIDEVKATARHLPPLFALTIAKMSGLFVQPIFDLASEEIAFGRIALVGDAAFVARPHCGAGVSKAAADVLALIAALAAAPDVAAGLRAFSRMRVPAGQKIVAWGRRLGSYLGVHDGEDGAAQPISPSDVVRYTGIDIEDTPG